MQMDDVTQQNASLVEEAAAAAGALEDQAAKLLKSVSMFKLDGDQTVLVADRGATIRQPMPVTSSVSKLRNPGAPRGRIQHSEYSPKAVASFSAAADEWEQF